VWAFENINQGIAPSLRDNGYLFEDFLHVNISDNGSKRQTRFFCELHSSPTNIYQKNASREHHQE